jgi:protein SCO1
MKRLLLPLLLLGMAFNGCNKKGGLQQADSHGHHEHGAHHETSMPHDHHHPPGEALAMAEPSDLSLFNVSSQWNTHLGKRIKLGYMRGKIQLVAMVYTSCEYTCPRIVADMIRLEKAVSAQFGDQVGLVLVTIDPERDTPDKLRAFAEKSNLDPDKWLLLQGQDQDILELAALLGVQFKKTSNTDFSHSNLITVLNKEGEIIHRQEGLGVNPDECLEAIQRAVLAHVHN